MAHRPTSPRRLVARARVYVRARRHSALLAAIIATFVVRPLIGEGLRSLIVFNLALFVLLLVALYNIQVDELVGDREALLKQRRRRAIVGWLLAVPALIERFAVLLTRDENLLLLGTASWFAFFAFVTWSELRSLLKHREVTGETISLSISVYLLMGLTWGLFFILLHEAHPDAFNLDVPPGSDALAAQQHLFPVFIYFSLTTLATIGYGDITPLSLQARYAAVAEGITGQFYLAILVARLVGMHMSQTAVPPPERPGPPHLE